MSITPEKIEPEQQGQERRNVTNVQKAKETGSSSTCASNSTHTKCQMPRRASVSHARKKIEPEQQVTMDAKRRNAAHRETKKTTGTPPRKNSENIGPNQMRRRKEHTKIHRIRFRSSVQAGRSGKGGAGSSRCHVHKCVRRERQQITQIDHKF